MGRPRNKEPIYSKDNIYNDREFGEFSIDIPIMIYLDITIKPDISFKYGIYTIIYCLRKNTNIIYEYKGDEEDLNDLKDYVSKLSTDTVFNCKQSFLEFNFISVYNQKCCQMILLPKSVILSLLAEKRHSATWGDGRQARHNRAGISRRPAACRWDTSSYPASHTWQSGAACGP